MLQKASVLTIPLLLTLATLPGCSHRKISKQELQSELRSTTSLVAETQMFIDYIRQGHATRHFAEEHAMYLADEAKRSAKKLAQARPEKGSEDIVHGCRAQLERLSGELAAIPTAIGNDDALAVVKDALTRMRADLEKAQSY
jgi:hypothetical protein